MLWTVDRRRNVVRANVVRDAARSAVFVRVGGNLLEICQKCSLKSLELHRQKTKQSVARSTGVCQGGTCHWVERKILNFLLKKTEPKIKQTQRKPSEAKKPMVRMIFSFIFQIHFLTAGGKVCKRRKLFLAVAPLAVALSPVRQEFLIFLEFLEFHVKQKMRLRQYIKKPPAWPPRWPGQLPRLSSCRHRSCRSGTHTRRAVPASTAS